MSHQVSLNRTIAGTAQSASRWSLRPPVSGERSKIIRRKVRRTTTTAGSWTIGPARDLAEDPALRDT